MNELLEYNDNEETIRKIIGRNKIKYEKLTKLLDDSITNLTNFVINGDSILIDMHRYMTSNSEYEKEDLTIVISAALINIIAHYRNYFALNGWYPNIYFLADKSDTSINLSKSMELMRLILRYIPRAYFIDTTNLKTGIVIKYFLSKKSDNLILTRDDFDIMHINDHTSCIKAFGEKSKFYSIDNWQYVMSKETDLYDNVSYKLLNIILSFTGGHGRPGVKGLGFRTMLKKISKGIERHKIINDKYSSMADFICDAADCINGKKKEYNFDPAFLNFESYDIDTNYNKDVTVAIQKRLDSYIEDKFSKKDLIMLNTKYFTGENYLMLDELMIEPKKSEVKW